MTALTRLQKILLLFIVLVSLLGLAIIVYFDEIKGQVLSLTDSAIVTVTGDVPHILTVQIKPESRIPPIGNDDLPLQVEIRQPGETLPVVTITATADSLGSAALGTISAVTVPPGTYDVAIKGRSHLRKVFENQNLDGPVIRNYALLLPQLPAGDAHPTADNYVNGMDISYLHMTVYSADARADLTNDGIVNSLDYSALLRNLHSYGDQ
ncbi:MAG: hypothetical protein QY312_04175 [Candidatus Dojkabacteria bacterium]|nr:MAG: hypothetical protein QY312_04175 [Candidatus Dojkabacteria bacterium]